MTASENQVEDQKFYLGLDARSSVLQEVCHSAQGRLSVLFPEIFIFMFAFKVLKLFEVFCEE